MSDDVMPPAEVHRTRVAKTARILRNVGGIVVLVVLLVLVGCAFKSCSGSPKKATAEKPAATTTEPPITTVANGMDPRFIQEDTGYGGSNRVTESGLQGETVEEYTASILDITGHNAHTLAVFANAAGLWPDPNDFDSLLTSDKSYLSQEGIGLWYSLKGALTARGTTAEIVDAPANGTNTGVGADGTFGKSASPGISGNRKCIVYTFEKGGKLYALIRCGNIVYLVCVGLPTVPTDECPIRNSDPSGLYTPHHPGTATYYDPPAPVDPNAPTYQDGNAELTEDNRGTEPDQTGGIGTGSGGVTPPATTTGDTGSTESNTGGGTIDTTTDEDVSTNPTGTIP